MPEQERSLLNICLMDALAPVPMNISSCFASVAPVKFDFKREELRRETNSVVAVLFCLG